VEVLRKTTKNLSRDSRCPGRDSDRSSPEYKPRILPLNQPVQFNVQHIYTFKNSPILLQIVFVFFTRFSEEIAVISLNSINRQWNVDAVNVMRELHFEILKHYLDASTAQARDNFCVQK
jgi:hypothetical protein